MEYIEKVYCISLKDEESRRKMMAYQLEKYFPNKWKFVDATSVKDPIVEQSVNNLMLIDRGITAMSQVAICYSHLECMKDIYKNKYTYALVIEDDIRLIENFPELLNKYWNNTANLNEYMKNEPYVLHLSAAANFKEKKYKFEKYDDTIIVSITCNIVNHQTAKILIDNFLPIKWQFDRYLYDLVKEKKIKELVATPILGWDISSTFFKNYWIKEDIELRSKIRTTSTINEIITKNIKPLLILKQDELNESNYNKLYKLFIDKLTINNKLIINNKACDFELHHILPNSKQINDNSILLSYGLENPNDTFILDLCTQKTLNIEKIKFLTLRGKLSKEILEKQLNHTLTNIYFEPLILLKKQKHDELIKKILSNNDICENYEDAVIKLIFNNKIKYNTNSKDFFKLNDFLSGFNIFIKESNKIVEIKLDNTVVDKKIEEIKSYPIVMNLL